MSLPPTTTSLYSVMVYKGQMIRDFCFHARLICFLQSKMPGFCCNKVVAGDRDRAWKVSHRRPYIPELNLSANQHEEKWFPSF